jgi:lysine 2,3-aminomutase
MHHQYNADEFRREAAAILGMVAGCRTLNSARQRLFERVTDFQFDTVIGELQHIAGDIVTVRDAARAMRSVLKERSDKLSKFSVTQALWDLARGKPREDLTPAFFADIGHMIMGVEGRTPHKRPGEYELNEKLSGRAAARQRSDELDAIWDRVQARLDNYATGLQERAVRRRRRRRHKILEKLGVDREQWNDWRWQVKNIITDPDKLAKLVPLTDTELESARRACKGRLPFGVTPYYASLMDERPELGRDRAIRAQVLPPPDYVTEMLAHRGERDRAFDFMLEHDTSPIDLVTRRYPAIVILKPFNTCPQICVYCQRNWEIDQAMDPGALAPAKKIEAACQWIEDHPAIREVLVTGGDPLGLPDDELQKILDRLARIDHVDVIRLGTRTPVTMPMRITRKLAGLLGSYREPGRREICLVTHFEHPYEVTPWSANAVDRIRRQGISIFNQQVFTFFVSRRFETAQLRLTLRLLGIDPYYTFMPKGKEETAAYRVPLARMLQEQKEEARILPGSRRTDEAVYNVPGLGKNYLRATQHRDMVTVLPSGERVYEFHPWEKKIAPSKGYLGTDVPILGYLNRLAEIGEDPEDYESIWYYY